MKSKKIKILLAEDDINLGFVVQDNLTNSHFKVDLCTDGEMALKHFADNHYDLCLLDVMMPKKDGFSVAECIRKINKEIPIVFLTAKSMQIDKIKGLFIGADDYVTKPFDFNELLLRINAILKRTNPQNNTSEIQSYNIGKYLFDVKNQLLKLGEDEIKLTIKETKILTLLSESINNVVPREIILQSIWGKNDYFIGRSMDVFISKLRKYLNKDKNIQINNLHGVGFKLEIRD